MTTAPAKLRTGEGDYITPSPAVKTKIACDGRRSAGLKVRKNKRRKSPPVRYGGREKLALDSVTECNTWALVDPCEEKG
ncbi:hypothetical protein Bpfe_023248, partial [Biomphalaria pfeifferi]